MKRDAVPQRDLSPCTCCGKGGQLAITVAVCGSTVCERLVTGKPVPMILFCPSGHRHIDEGDFAEKAHHTHACQDCGLVWRPAITDTVGVRFLPGYKNATSPTGSKEGGA